MKQVLFGALIAAAGALTTISGAHAQGWGYNRGFRDAPPAYAHQQHDDWEHRMERREQRREFRRQQRELAEMRAYEAGKRDAWQAQRGQRWGYR
jgi:hypothetical protein